MGKDWIEYQCNSGQTLFVYNKVTGEHKWPHGLGQGIEYRIMHGRPVDYKEYRTAATQTNDNGCNNGCMSMYIDTDLSNISRKSNPIGCSDNENTDVHKKAIKLEHIDEQEEGHSSGMDLPDENDLVENSVVDNEMNNKNTLIDNQAFTQRHYNISEMLGDLEGSNSSTRQHMLKNTKFIETNRFPMDGCNEYDKNGDIYDGEDYDDNVDKDFDNFCNGVDSGGNDSGNVSGKKDEDLHFSGHAAKNEPIHPHVGVNNYVNTPNNALNTPVIFLNPNNLKVVTMEMAPGVKCDSNDLLTDEDEMSQVSKMTTDQENHECPLCNKVFKRKRYLKKHLNSSLHTGEKTFECDLCHKKFSRKDTLRLHIRFHTGENLFKCPYCSKKFSKKWNFSQHISIHKKEKIFRCSVCSQNFSQEDKLSEHFKTHIGQNPFECSVCEMQFIHKAEFDEHLEIHSKERPLGYSQDQLG